MTPRRGVHLTLTALFFDMTASYSLTSNSPDNKLSVLKNKIKTRIRITNKIMALI